MPACMTERERERKRESHKNTRRNVACESDKESQSERHEDQRPPSDAGRPKRGEMLSSGVGEKPDTNHGVVYHHKITQKMKHRRNHSQGASGENPRQDHSRRAGEKVTQQEYEDSEKNAKIWSDDEKNRKSRANGRQKSKANGRQKSIANGRQKESIQQQAKRTKGLRPRQGEIRGETHHGGKLQPARPEACKNRCRRPAGAV